MLVILRFHLPGMFDPSDVFSPKILRNLFNIGHDLVGEGITSVDPLLVDEGDGAEVRDLLLRFLCENWRRGTGWLLIVFAVVDCRPSRLLKLVNRSENQNRIITVWW